MGLSFAVYELWYIRSIIASELGLVPPLACISGRVCGSTPISTVVPESTLLVGAVGFLLCSLCVDLFSCCVVLLSILRYIYSAFAWGSVANLPVPVGLMASGWLEATVGFVQTIFVG